MSTRGERTGTHPEGVARRELLKRLGVAAGVAWAAPVLTTMHTPASAAAAGTPNPQQCSGGSSSAARAPAGAGTFGG